MSLLILATVLPWVLLWVGCWLLYQLVRQYGRILIRLELLEERLRQKVPAPTRPPGLPVGTDAPEFELPDLSGNRRRLVEFRGRKLLLLFFNPECGFCMRMASALAKFPAAGAEGLPLLVVVSTGDPGKNRAVVEEFRIRCPVLLQQRMEVAERYQVDGTPIGYLVDEQGTIASPRAIGAEALLELAEVPADGPGAQTEPEAEGKGKQSSKGKANRGLAASRLLRTGLKAGTLAPRFRLPRVGGGEVALDEYRGRRVLLVFSDPECGPCAPVATALERLHRERADVQIVMISRRDPELNRRKVVTLGLTFPVALQRHWEISRLFGIFATPVGYWIDEEGVIGKDVAKGLEEILQLVPQVRAGHETERRNDLKPVALGLG
jgi:peroxiredoxin